MNFSYNIPAFEHDISVDPNLNVGTLYEIHEGVFKIDPNYKVTNVIEKKTGILVSKPSRGTRFIGTHDLGTNEWTMLFLINGLLKRMYLSDIDQLIEIA